MTSAQSLPLLAGQRPDGQLIYEELPVRPLAEADAFELLRSPAFCKGIAKGDYLRRLPAGRFEIIKQGGNLAIRIIAKQGIERLAELVASSVKAINGSLDEQTERMLMVSIPVSAGFDVIEAMMSDLLASVDDSTWFYGNVYDAMDGETPLNWWVNWEGEKNQVQGLGKQDDIKE
jgi:hypothetical protein